MKTKWKFDPASPELVEKLCAELSIPPFLAEMLIRRGLSDPDSAREFLNPSLDNLIDPYQMKDMDKAVARIQQAIESGEKIIIYGDYDADGITSVAVLKRALEMLGVQPDYFIPRRLEEGYGLKEQALARIAEEGYGLVITVDCGIRAVQCAEFALEKGLDLIITDHHLPEDETPPAFAVVNPRQESCSYPYKDLAGVGVVFKLVQCLFTSAGKQDLVSHFLKLAAIGTVADMVPLTGENRVITFWGLKGLSNPRNPGLKALLSGSGIGMEADSRDIGFKIAPRLNAYTRMGGGSEIVELFFQSEWPVVSTIVKEMNEKNNLRKSFEKEIINEIEEQLRARPVSPDDDFLLFHGKGWHKGIIGIVASRMTNRFYRPCLVLSVGEDSCQGSGRSIPHFHLLEALTSCKDLLSRFGGHAQAAGCSLDTTDPERIEQLRARLNEYAGTVLKGEQKTRTLDIDVYIPIHQIGPDFFNQIKLLEPFGKENPEPVFASRNVQVLSEPRLLNGRGIKMEVLAGNREIDMIWWQKESIPEKLKAGCFVDVAYSLQEQNYEGNRSVYLNVRDLKVFQGSRRFE